MPTLEAETMRSIAVIDAQISEIDSRMPTARRRDAAAAQRPDGCECFGAGGTGRLIAVENGQPIFEQVCAACPEGQALGSLVEDRLAAVKRVTDINRMSDQAYLDDERGDWIRAAVERSGLATGAYDDRFAAFRRLAAPMSEMLIGLTADLEEQFSQSIKIPHGVFLTGPAGHGKTGLARCCGRIWIEQRRNALFIGAGAIFNRLYRGYSRGDGSADVLLEQLRGAPLLIVDDLGTERPTEHNRSHLLDLLMWRHAERNRLVTIITSNFDIRMTAARIAGIDDLNSDEVKRISGRLNEMCDVMRVESKDLRSPAA